MKSELSREQGWVMKHIRRNFYISSLVGWLGSVITWLVLCSSWQFCTTWMFLDGRTKWTFFLLFQSGKYGKINKCVTFPDMLDMVPFVTGSGDNPPLYFLYAVVVHVDTENASFSGHYISYVKDMQGTWLRIDDSEVRFTTRSTVK